MAANSNFAVVWDMTPFVMIDTNVSEEYTFSIIPTDVK
jgi:hypothetical protein